MHCEGGSKVCDVTVGTDDDEMRRIEFGRDCEIVRGSVRCCAMQQAKLKKGCDID